MAIPVRSRLPPFIHHEIPFARMFPGEMYLSIVYFADPHCCCSIYTQARWISSSEEQEVFQGHEILKRKL